MRLALLILMIALLPLRGWAASAMVVEHGTLLDFTKLVATSAYDARATVGFDTKFPQQGTGCPHAAVQTATTADHHQNSHPNGSTHVTHTSCACASCGFCHLSTAIPTQAATPETTLLAAMPAQPVSRFASVTAPPGLKPPIR